MIAISDVRKEFARVLQAFPLNVYAYPEPQPEYPAWRLQWIDSLLLHQSHCRDGVQLDITMQLLVSDADVEDATSRLEDIVNSGVIEALEDEKSAVWSALLISEVRNFRQLDDVNALACDVVVTVNV